MASERPASWPVLYSLADVPSDLVEKGDLELVISWEISKAELERSELYTIGTADVEQLLRRKAEEVLAERGAVCLRVRHEHIVRKTNYMHNSTVLAGTFHVTVYGPATN